MNNYFKWKDVKNSMISLSEEEKTEVDLLAEIISKIVERRQELGISQRELEKMTGIKQEAICRIENMKNKPQLNTIIKIMKPLGIKISIVKAS